MRMSHVQRLIVVLAFASCLSTRAYAAIPAARARIIVKAAGDAGVQINAADEHLGLACGAIVVMPGGGATVQTPVHLSACHDLEIDAPLSWAEHLSLSGKNKVSAAGAKALQSMNFTGSWATAAGATQLEVAGVWATWKTLKGGDDGNRLLLCRACSDVAVHDTHSSGGGYIKTDSLANTYREVNAGNSSYRIHAMRNFVDGRLGPNGGLQAAWYAYTWDVEDADATIQNAGLAITWWGGNNNKDWTGYAPATLKAGRMHFSGGSARNVVAGWWGCMGQHIVVERVVVNGCQDVCLDSEGDLDVLFRHFSAAGAVNGELSTFFHSQGIIFRDGTVQHTLGAKGDSFFNNNSTNDLTYSRDVTLERIAFTCGGESAICSMTLDPIARFTLQDSRLVNTRIRNSKFAPEQGDEFILANTFIANGAQAEPWSVLDLSTYGFGSSTVCGNHFVAEHPPLPGSAAILASNAYNNGRPGDILIAANEARGWPNSVSIKAETNATRFPAHVTLRNNRFEHEASIRQDVNMILELQDAALKKTLPTACGAAKPF